MAQVLDKQAQLDRFTFWDNRDWDFYQQQIPFFDCPDVEVVTTYYYRWELLTKHLTYGSPNSGYNFTEFIDRPFWSGAYGAISCPAGHQLYEARWLHSPRFARDYARYWFRTPGAQPRRYSTWLADAIWAIHLVHPDREFVVDLLPDLISNYQAWEKEHFVPEVGLFWQTGHDDGMEYNINSRQTADLVRGAPGFRPTLNSYMYADALAIAEIASLAGQQELAATFRQKAANLKRGVQEKLWDEKRQFFFHMFMRDEEREGHIVKAMTLTHQTGRYAGSPHGRELIGYVPWQFRLPDAGYESAWKFLMDRNYFYADYGPTTVERYDPLFYLSPTCCWWSGQSWPYATTQTLKAMANLLQYYNQQFVTRDDYVKLLHIYAITHRKAGQPYIAEACHPDTGSFEGHDSYNHSEHYFHSGYVDLIITGLIGLQPRADDVLELRPLAPLTWDYFALDDVSYHGRKLSIVWDKTGSKYRLGAGLHILVDGKRIAGSDKLENIRFDLPAAENVPYAPSTVTRVNWAVNNDGTYYPRITASYCHPETLLSKIQDGNYWYHVHPPNRWTTAGSPHPEDWLEINFGTARPADTVALYVLDDGDQLQAPAAVKLETWHDGQWRSLTITEQYPASVTGHRANYFRFSPQLVSRLRVWLTHTESARSGLTEVEVWGDARLPVSAPPLPEGNLAYNPGNQPYPKASASHTSPYDRVEWAIDGRIVFTPSPHNRWTAYQSPRQSDWLEVDFGAPRRFGRVELAIYDDRGGVQAPEEYRIQYWNGHQWVEVSDVQREPPRPQGGVINSARFTPVESQRVRVVFHHRGSSRSGVTEILVWPE